MSHNKIDYEMIIARARAERSAVVGRAIRMAARRAMTVHFWIQFIAIASIVPGLWALAIVWGQ